MAVLTDQAHTATARVQEIEKRAEDLKAALASAQAVVQRVTAELEAERVVHGKTRESLSLLVRPVGWVWAPKSTFCGRVADFGAFWVGDAVRLCGSM